MDAHDALQRFVAILVILAGAWGGVHADPVYTYQGHFNLRIPTEPDSSKGWMADAIIDVTDHLVISDLDVRISITHANVFDLQLFLQSPFGTKLCLNMYDLKKEFSVYPNYTNTIFDDEAELMIKQAEAPFTGRFRPIEPYQLSEFDGEDSFGLWRLQICDMWDWDTGTLDSFELMITTPEPSTATLLTFGVGLLLLLRPRRYR
jgi:subtilisin-like proprotein convertase family protein